MDDLLQEFIAETRETLEALAGEIVAWEADPSDRGRLDAIFRFVHTVKGSCGFLDLPRLQRLSHAAEDVLADVRSGKRAADRALVNAVLAIVDRIGELVEAIDAGSSVDDSGEELLIAALAEGTDAVAGQASAPIAARAPARSVRLNVELLDRMMSGMSDMVLARNELARHLRESDTDPKVEAALERMSATVSELRDTVTRTRMQKIEALFSALPRLVRDTAAALGKSVTLHIEGSDVELDREMIEVMRDPLVHIVRNAIDHGIETPAERRAAGKRENGRLTVSARQSGNQILVEVIDDGRGIDADRLIRKLVSNGAHNERDLRALSDRAKLDLVFEPGLSTKDEVTEISGRGVGMDVVRAAIEQFGGRVELDSAPGRGLRIVIHVPLTLSIISTIVVGVADQRFAIPRQSIEEIVTETGDAIRIDRVGNTPVATVRDRCLPLVDLGDLLGIAGADRSSATKLAIVSAGGGSYALAVETVLDNEELVIKPAAPVVMATGLYAGQTLPDSGLPMLVLDGAGIATAANIVFARDVSRHADDAPVEEETIAASALLFTDLDGALRAIPLGIVDRVEQVEASSVRFSAGRLRVAIDGAIFPLVARGELAGRERFAVLRLKDGGTELCYAVVETSDIVALPEDLVPASEDGPVAGVALLGGDQVELVDPLWLFAHHAGATGKAEMARPLCLVPGGADNWVGSFLRPLLQASGYRVVTRLKSGEKPDIVLLLDQDDAAMVEASGAPVVRLSADPEASGASVYRYDRPGLLAALRAQAAGGRG